MVIDENHGQLPGKCEGLSSRFASDRLGREVEYLADVQDNVLRCGGVVLGE